MARIKRINSIKTKIIVSTLIPVIMSFLLICSVLFTSLFHALRETAEAELLQIGQKHAVNFESKINHAMNYLTIIASTLERQIETGAVDREELQKTVFAIFERYGQIDGSSIYFESNRYDGKDAAYTGTEYGTARSGKICYYFYIDSGKTAYLPEALADEIEFELPHYTEAKKANKPIYTEPAVYEVDGRVIPMFTLTYPIRNADNAFIGAVTVDLFLEDLHEQIQNETIYKTGYIVIANDHNQVVYSPHFEDIGKDREDASLVYALPSEGESSVFFPAKSILNQKETMVAIESIYIPQLDSRFFVSAAVPSNEIYANGYRLLGVLTAISISVAAGIAFLLFFLIGRISAPLRVITEGVNRIAKGAYDTRIQGDFSNEFAIVTDSVNALADSIESYVKESNSSLNILKNILNGLDAYIYVTDPETDVLLFINEKMEAHFQTGDDALGRYCYSVLRENLEDRCEFCPCYQLDQAPDTVIVWEEHNSLTNRDYRNTDCYIEWIGGIKAHLRHSVDITDLKTYMNDKLTAEREALEFKHKKEKAEEAAQAKNDFLAKMSHEIRTPMNAVMGMTELILRKDLPQDVYENALVIKSASANLLSIINDILDLSKIESGKLEIIDTEYLLPSLVHDVISVINVRLIEQPIQFIVYIDPSIPAALIGDEIRIRQILLNLLSNAVKYTREGHISLSVLGAVSGDTVTLTIEVADSGVGIQEADIEKLFGDFVQIDAVKNKGIEGTGLGLAITRNLCRLMGGDITLRSEYEKGSVFTVTLPQRFEDGAPFASVESDGMSILLYETREIYLQSIVRSLESLKIPFTCVDNIPAFFEALEDHSHVFVSSFLCGSISPVLSKLECPPKLVLLADMSEMSAPKHAKVLTLPAHALSIANILNQVVEKGEGMSSSGVSFTAPEAKVLIVDDIMANLKVAEGLLLPFEVQVSLCTSGLEAIRLISENHYDLVFMDHMMPQMDGLETTRRIRDLDGAYFKSLPIIALTANAVYGVREMFVQNGMNDFIAKPIETAKLDAIMEKWIPKEKRESPSASGQAGEGSGITELLRTVPELSVQKALSVVGNSEQTYERIVRLSVRLLPENIARLNSLVEADLPNYAIEVHGIKGVLNSIGAYDLGMTAFELENRSKDGDHPGTKALHPGFMEQLTAFSDKMLTLMEETETVSKPEGELSLLRDALPQLTDAMDFFDSETALAVLVPLQRQTFGQEADRILAELTEAVERFDYDTAEEGINQLKSLVNEYGGV